MPSSGVRMWFVRCVRRVVDQNIVVLFVNTVKTISVVCIATTHFLECLLLCLGQGEDGMFTRKILLGAVPAAGRPVPNNVR